VNLSHSFYALVFNNNIPTIVSPFLNQASHSRHLSLHFT
jgi:hypothetical protein